MRDENEHSRIEHELVREDRGTDPFSAAVRGTRMPMIITDPSQTDNPIVFVNASFCKLTGFSPDEVIGRNCRFLQGPETNKDDVLRLREAITACEAMELEILNYRKDGGTFWNRLLVSPVFDDDGNITYFFASQYDVSRQRERLVRLQQEHDELEVEVGQHASDLRAAENRLEIALNAARLGSWTLDLLTDRLTVTDRSKENFGRSPEDLFTYEDIKAAVHPEDRARRDEAIRIAIEETNFYHAEYRILTPSGELKWLAVSGQVFYRADGTPLQIVGVSQDITERKQAEEHRALLSAEFSHRVKNLSANMQAIAHQTLRFSKTMEEARDTLVSRMQALDAANEFLTGQRSETTELSKLVERALAPFRQATNDQFTILGHPGSIRTQIATNIALALHELATNATKYGALSTEHGRVTVGWTMQGDKLLLRWEETGGPEVATPDRKGFGTSLLSRVLGRELNGQVRLDYRPSGVVFEATLPTGISSP